VSWTGCADGEAEWLPELDGEHMGRSGDSTWVVRLLAGFPLQQPGLAQRLKGTELMITPAARLFTNRSLYGPHTAAGTRACPRPPTPGLGLKHSSLGWRASPLAPM
jgi:hypothetical protein